MVYTPKETRSNDKSRGEGVVVKIAHAITRDDPSVGDSFIDEQGFHKKRLVVHGKRQPPITPGEGGGSSGVAGDVSSGYVEPGNADSGGGYQVPITPGPKGEILFPAGDKMEVDCHRKMDGELFMECGSVSLPYGMASRRPRASSMSSVSIVCPALLGTALVFHVGARPPGVVVPGIRSLASGWGWFSSLRSDFPPSIVDTPRQALQTTSLLGGVEPHMGNTRYLSTYWTWEPRAEMLQ